VNRAGTQRAVRVAVLYVVAVLALTAILTALDLNSSEASRPAVQQGLELFLGVAFALIVGSVLFTFYPAPRSVEVVGGEATVVGRWGRRHELGPIDGLVPKVVRHFPAGPLSTRPVDMVEVRDGRGRKRVYQVESGLFDPEPAPGATE
jgi:hypothetical protein